MEEDLRSDGRWGVLLYEIPAEARSTVYIRPDIGSWGSSKSIGELIVLFV